MKQPPKMLTPKDCLYIADILNATLTLAKKMNFYATNVEKSKIAASLSANKQKLSKQYETLLAIMEEK